MCLLGRGCDGGGGASQPVPRDRRWRRRLRRRNTVGLKDNGIPAVGFNGARTSTAKTRDGQLAFRNKRAEAWWRFRAELDPDKEFGSAVALPRNASIKADLAAPRWELTARGITIEDKDQIRKRLGHSPDDGDAIVMCLAEGARAAARQLRAQQSQERPERANLGYAHMKQRFWG